MFNFLKRVFFVSNKIRVIILNTLFWLIFIILLAVILSGNIKYKSDTLFIEIIGDVVDTSAKSTFMDFLINNNSLPQYTVLSDITSALSTGSGDKKIKRVIFDLDSMGHLGAASAEEIGKEIEKFKGAGKEVITFSSSYNRDSFYIASYSNTILMDPYGDFALEGLSIERLYYKKFFDKYNLDVEVFRAGEYKSYVEPYLESEMSSEVKTQNLLWMNSIWNRYKDTFINNRELDKSSFENYFNNRVAFVKKYSGDYSKLCINEKFVDTLITKEDFYNEFNNIYPYKNYLYNHKKSRGRFDIAILNLEGDITYSDSSSGSINGVNIVKKLDEIKSGDYSGLVLRINSGGGGVFASELIRRKVEEVNKVIPVVISMGDVCASGGYWIATAGSRIYANNNSITGSIGVFGLLFGVENSLKKNLLINSDGVSTEKLYEPHSFTKNISGETREILQLNVDNTYSMFLDIVSKSRNIEIEYLKNSLAGGRVWSGNQAKEYNLVDNIGGLKSALSFFGENINPVYLEEENSVLEEIFDSFSNTKINIFTELSLLERVRDKKNIYSMFLWK